MTWKHLHRRKNKAAKNGGKLKKRLWAPTAAVLLIAAGSLVFIRLSAPVQAKENLMEGVVPEKTVVADRPDAAFLSRQADFSADLLRKTYQTGKNNLISPVSVSFALGMTANGAQGNTLKEFENVLGGGMGIEGMNRNYASLAGLLKSSEEGKLLLCNSVWYKSGFSVRKDFLQTNADYFGADAFSLDFSDASAPEKINRWVRDGTDGKIEKLIERIPSDAVMYLINTLYLEQDWETPYMDSTEGVFHSESGNEKAQFLNSEEVFLHDGSARGILKPLKDPNYAFAAILPEGDTLERYVESLTGEGFLSLMRTAGEDMAYSKLPAFRFDCSEKLGDALKSLGLTDAFGSPRTDFGKMTDASGKSLFISDVLQKTHIELDRQGLTAAAATRVGVCGSGIRMTETRLDFDRPFLFAVVDTRTLLPLFFGTVETPGVSAS